jgi:hypothetical protein
MGVEPVDQLRGQTHGKRTHGLVARGVEPYPVYPVLARLRRMQIKRLGRLRNEGL